MIKLTKKQQEIYDFVVKYCIDNGFSPTIAEIAEHFDFKSQNAAQCHVDAIVEKGRLTRKAGASRSLRPVAHEPSKCENCNAPFEQIRADHVTCSAKCSYDRARKNNLVGSMFEPEMKQARIRNKYLRMGVRR